MCRFFKKRKKKKEKEENVSLIKCQSDRIEEMKREIARLNAETERYKIREEGVADALCLARQKAKDYEEEAKIRFSLEYERLEGYRRQWRGYIHNLDKAQKLGEEIIKTERLLKKCAQEIRERIEEEIPFCSQPNEDYLEETERMKEVGFSPCDVAFGVNEGVLPEETPRLSDEELKELILQLIEK